MYEEILGQVVDIVVLAISGIFAWVIIRAKNYLDKMANQEENKLLQHLAAQAVRKAEQVGLSSEGKRNEALDTLNELAARYNINVTPHQVETLVESTYNAIKKDMNAADSE